MFCKNDYGQYLLALASDRASEPASEPASDRG